jgi:ABC-2 type transport system permease protein
MQVYLRYLKSESVTTLWFALFLLVFGYALAVVFPSIGEIQMAQDYVESLPRFMKALLGKEILDFTTVEGFLTVEYFNTTWLLVMGVFSCLFAGALVAEETEKKTLEILLSAPVSRTSFIVGKFAGFCTLLAVLSGVSFLGVHLGVVQTGEALDRRLMAYIFLSGTTCIATVGGVGLFLSCLFNEQRRAVGATIAVFFSLYFFNVIARLLDQYPSVKYPSLFQYYDASEIFGRQAIHWPDMAILLGVLSVMFGAAIVAFRRKDIYV